MDIEIRGLGIRFRAGVEAARGIDLTVRSGEFVAVVGPSGCGKSTMLNAIACLLSPEEAEVTGEILADGKDVRSCAARDLNFGYVFQRDNLLPWRTIADNVQTGLEIRGVDAPSRRKRTAELLELAGLTGFEHYYPHQVSGGMRQRTSLIRTLAYDPDVILMDEPFGALDAQTRMILQGELLRIWERTHKTILFVTHDLAEAIILAQRVVLFSKRPGFVRQVYESDLPYPRDPFELRGSPRFGELETTIWQTLRDDFRSDPTA
ncbi:MAG: ABC transporter ATP-binding protein [Chloroflexi bacterium]|nr:ABC transporter ATP-binding protein [Chloroflexota bacterium]